MSVDEGAELKEHKSKGAQDYWSAEACECGSVGGRERRSDGAK